MTLKSWKDEFYPKEAHETSKEEAVDHCLNKWKGLRAKNLKKHGLIAEAYNHIEEKNGISHSRFYIDGDTCALCFHYYDENLKPYLCKECPLFIVRGNFTCDKSLPEEETAPYQQWGETRDPEPMIKWLKKAKKFEKKKNG